MTSAITCKRDGLAKAHHIGRDVGMMVDNSARSNSIGRALLAASIAEARLAEGLSMLTLTVITINAQDVVSANAPASGATAVSSAPAGWTARSTPRI